MQIIFFCYIMLRASLYCRYTHYDQDAGDIYQSIEVSTQQCNLMRSVGNVPVS